MKPDQDAARQENPRHRGLSVLKFGSSVLHNEAAYAAAAQEVYRRVREGGKLVVVVSAQEGDTDALLASAQTVGSGKADHLIARAARVGELKSAALMGLALERVGVRARVAEPHEIGLKAEGAPGDALPTELDADRVHACLRAHDVVVVPGFTADHAEYGVATLGRGGSDLSAVFIAAKLGVEDVWLMKDVDGCYSDDPNRDDHARRYDRLDYQTAKQASHGLIQPKALDWAEDHAVVVHVAALGKTYSTRIGKHEAVEGVNRDVRPLRVALLGCGTVGAGVLSALQSRPDLFRLNPVLVRDPSKPSRPQGASYTADLEEALGNDPDLVVEVIGGADKPAALMQKLLAAGVDVVTANKTAMAHHGPDLRAAAEASGADLRYSAAVGGGMPALETIDAYAGHIRAIEGVMNGTANFLLSALAEGEDFADAVARAQALGFAEADPSADVDSHDAAEKLSLAIWHAFGVYRHPGDIAKASLRDVTPEQVQAAREKGEVLKQVARCSFSKTGGLCADVSILPLRSDDPLARTVAEGNCVSLTLTNGEVVSVHGKGAGRWPTAASVFADIMDIQQAQRGPQRKGKAARVAVSSNAAVKVAVNAGSQVQQ